MNNNSLKVLQEEWFNCQRCGLHVDRPRQEIVFGAGRRSAKYVIVFDVPSEQDAEIGTPMTGREGNLLEELLTEAGIEIRDVFCVPLLGCRPTQYLPETDDNEARVIDRAPTKEEVKACFPRVQEIIYRVDPLVIFTLGDLAWKVLVEPKSRGVHTSLEKAVGYLFTTKVPGRWLDHVRYDVIALLSMQHIYAKPSVAAHGPRQITLRYLHQGRIYAEHIEKTGSHDAVAAGFDEIAAP